jgi:hypothetical protein
VPLLRIYAKDGELRTDLLAEVTGHTGRRFGHEGGVISLAVEGLGHFQDMAGTVFHAQTAALASRFYDMDFAGRRRFVFQIKGFSPELHER